MFDDIITDYNKLLPLYIIHEPHPQFLFVFIFSKQQETVEFVSGNYFISSVDDC